MDIQPIFPGVKYVTDGPNVLLAGCPPEIVKVLAQKQLPSPQTILLPDSAISQGESQVAVEFPLYRHLFGTQTRPLHPLRLVGSARRVEAARELMRLTLFGPDTGELEAWGLSAEDAENLSRETRWFHLRDDSGKRIPLKNLIQTTVLEEGEADLGWAKVRRLKPNVFEVKAGAQVEVIDLNLEEEQTPPYPVTSDLTVSSLVKLGVEVLGGSTGFSATQACSGLALCYNGNYMLIDAIPFLNYHLKARGIARNQVHSIFLTHIHDDHCNLISLLQYNRRIQVLTTPVVYQMMLHKLSLILDRPVERLKDYFDFLPLTPGQETDYYGLRITPFWSSHSIPTIGAQFETTHDGKIYRFIYTGDTQALKDMKRLQTTGVITPARYAEVGDLFHKAAHLLIADGGEGTIHGDPMDALESPADRVVFLHLDKLPEQFQAQFTVASSGKRFAILRGATDYNLTRTIEFLLEYFPGMPPVWISNLLANQHPLTYNAGDIIIRQGTRSEGFVYMILTGYAEVIYHDGEHRHRLAQMEAGELIGEMSVISGRGQRNASVVALSPVTVTAFSEHAFHGYIHSQQYAERLRAMWQMRELLQNFPCLKALQQPVVRSLSLRVALAYLEAYNGKRPLESICAAGGLLFPLGQELVVEEDGQARTYLPQSAPVFSRPGAQLVTESEFQYLVLKPEDAAVLRQQIPAFRFFWEETLGLPVPAG